MSQSIRESVSHSVNQSVNHIVSQSDSQTVRSSFNQITSQAVSRCVEEAVSQTVSVTIRPSHQAYRQTASNKHVTASKPHLLTKAIDSNITHTDNSRVGVPGDAGQGEGVRTGRHHTQLGENSFTVSFIYVYLYHMSQQTHTHTHTHTL